MSFAPSFAPSTTQNVNPSYQGLQTENYHPPTKFETFKEGLPLSSDSSSFSDDGSFRSVVISWVSDYLGIQKDDVEWTSGYSNDGGVSAGYVRQAYNGIPFVNAVANVSLMNNKVTSFGSSFVDVKDPSKIAASTPKLTAAEAISNAESKCGGSHNGVTPALYYLARQDGSVALVYSVQIQSQPSDGGALLEVYVDADSGEVLSITNFVAH
ncbi:hypothetical protein L218DRAFT_968344 [Marasmius fiardii PR-910]|nr:hypothetical protein L218DRAFT_968344 [Marasmius fiardii PR-910]